MLLTFLQTTSLVIECYLSYGYLEYFKLIPIVRLMVLLFAVYLIAAYLLLKLLPNNEDLPIVLLLLFILTCFISPGLSTFLFEIPATSYKNY